MPQTLEERLQKLRQGLEQPSSSNSSLEERLKELRGEKVTATQPEVAEEKVQDEFVGPEVTTESLPRTAIEQEINRNKQVDLYRTQRDVAKREDAKYAAPAQIYKATGLPGSNIIPTVGDEDGPVTTFNRGVIKGMTGTVTGTASGALQAAGDLPGQSEDSKITGQAASEINKYITRGLSVPISKEDDWGNYWADVAGAGIGSMLPFLVGGVGVKALTNPIGTGKAALKAASTAQAVGSAALEALVAGANAYDQAKEGGATPWEAAKAAAEVSAITVGTSFVTGKVAFGNLPAVAKVPLTAATEGGQEVIEGISQNYGERHYKDNYTTENLTKGWVENFVGGFVGGAAVGSAVSAVDTMARWGQDETGAPVPTITETPGAEPRQVTKEEAAKVYEGLLDAASKLTGAKKQQVLDEANKWKEFNERKPQGQLNLDHPYPVPVVWGRNEGAAIDPVTDPSIPPGFEGLDPNSIEVPRDIELANEIRSRLSVDLEDTVARADAALADPNTDPNQRADLQMLRDSAAAELAQRNAPNYGEGAPYIDPLFEPEPELMGPPVPADLDLEVPQLPIEKEYPTGQIPYGNMDLLEDQHGVGPGALDYRLTGEEAVDESIEMEDFSPDPRQGKLEVKIYENVNELINDKKDNLYHSTSPETALSILESGEIKRPDKYDDIVETAKAGASGIETLDHNIAVYETVSNIYQGLVERIYEDGLNETKLQTLKNEAEVLAIRMAEAKTEVERTALKHSIDGINAITQNVEDNLLELSGIEDELLGQWDYTRNQLHITKERRQQKDQDASNVILNKAKKNKPLGNHPGTRRDLHADVSLSRTPLVAFGNVTFVVDRSKLKGKTEPYAHIGYGKDWYNFEYEERPRGSVPLTAVKEAIIWVPKGTNMDSEHASVAQRLEDAGIKVRIAHTNGEVTGLHGKPEARPPVADLYRSRQAIAPGVKRESLGPEHDAAIADMQKQLDYYENLLSRQDENSTAAKMVADSLYSLQEDLEGYRENARAGNQNNIKYYQESFNTGIQETANAMQKIMSGADPDQYSLFDDSAESNSIEKDLWNRIEHYTNLVNQLDDKNPAVSGMRTNLFLLTDAYLDIREGGNPSNPESINHLFENFTETATELEEQIRQYDNNIDPTYPGDLELDPRDPDSIQVPEPVQGTLFDPVDTPPLLTRTATQQSWIPERGLLFDPDAPLPPTRTATQQSWMATRALQIPTEYPKVTGTTINILGQDVELDNVSDSIAKAFKGIVERPTTPSPDGSLEQLTIEEGTHNPLVPLHGVIESKGTFGEKVSDELEAVRVRMNLAIGELVDLYVKAPLKRLGWQNQVKVGQILNGLDPDTALADVTSAKERQQILDSVTTLRKAFDRVDELFTSVNTKIRKNAGKDVTTSESELSPDEDIEIPESELSPGKSTIESDKGMSGLYGRITNYFPRVLYSGKAYGNVDKIIKSDGQLGLSKIGEEILYNLQTQYGVEETLARKALAQWINWRTNQIKLKPGQTTAQATVEQFPEMVSVLESLGSERMTHVELATLLNKHYRSASAVNAPMFGSIEAKRSLDVSPFADPNPLRVADMYLNRAAQRFAEIKQLGQVNEKLEDLFAQTGKDAATPQLLKSAADDIKRFLFNDEQDVSTPQALIWLMRIATNRLKNAWIGNIMQSVQVARTAGIKNTWGAYKDFFFSHGEAKANARRSGATADIEMRQDADLLTMGEGGMRQGWNNMLRDIAKAKEGGFRKREATMGAVKRLIGDTLVTYTAQNTVMHRETEYWNRIVANAAGIRLSEKMHKALQSGDPKQIARVKRDLDMLQVPESFIEEYGSDSQEFKLIVGEAVNRTTNFTSDKLSRPKMMDNSIVKSMAQFKTYLYGMGVLLRKNGKRAARAFREGDYVEGNRIIATEMAYILAVLPATGYAIGWLRNAMYDLAETVHGETVGKLLDSDNYDPTAVEEYEAKFDEMWDNSPVMALMTASVEAATFGLLFGAVDAYQYSGIGGVASNILGPGFGITAEAIEGTVKGAGEVLDSDSLEESVDESMYQIAKAVFTGLDGWTKMFGWDPMEENKD